MKESEKEAASHAMEGALSVIEGDYFGAAAKFVRAALAVADETEVRRIVNEEAVKRANAIADAIEGERFGR